MVELIGIKKKLVCIMTTIFMVSGIVQATICLIDKTIPPYHSNMFNAGFHEDIGDDLEAH